MPISSKLTDRAKLQLSLEMEAEKARLSRELEAQKWEYKKQELQYLEAGQHLRSLNLLMWQIPGMAIAVTSGF